MSRQEDRPIANWAELCASRPDGWRNQRVLLECGEFLQAVKAVSGMTVHRRWLQFYSSPQVRLMPLPVYAKRHTAHYAHPEDTLRLALILKLRNAYFFPIKLVRETLKNLAEKHYPLVLNAGLSADDIRLLAGPQGENTNPRELIYGRVSKLLNLGASGFKPGIAPQGEVDLPAAMAEFQAWLKARLESASVN